MGGHVFVFQSTPVITDGRTQPAAGLAKRHRGFNPRPSSLTGERAVGLQVVDVGAVSIHARHH